ncbi:MAG: hypothetical protein AABZ39_02230 [Spirochaetota bacterium]
MELYRSGSGIQTIGGNTRPVAAQLAAKNAPLIPVTVGTEMLYEQGRIDIGQPQNPEPWVNFFRQDDWSSTAYFYLDKNAFALPPLAGVSLRTAGLAGDANAMARND